MAHRGDPKPGQPCHSGIVNLNCRETRRPNKLKHMPCLNPTTGKLTKNRDATTKPCLFQEKNRKKEQKNNKKLCFFVFFSGKNNTNKKEQGEILALGQRGSWDHPQATWARTKIRAAPRIDLWSRVGQGAYVTRWPWVAVALWRSHFGVDEYPFATYFDVHQG